MASKRSCKEDPNNFCYVCGKHIKHNAEKRKIDLCSGYSKSYELYFGMKICDQEKSWAPHFICGTCRRSLQQWMEGKLDRMQFAIPRIWREPSNHTNDCYFCMVDLPSGGRHSLYKKIEYPNIPSSMAPVPHSEEYPIPEPRQCSDQDVQEEESSYSEDEPATWQEKNELVQESFSQEELSDLIRDLELNKSKSELLASRLAEKNLLSSECRLSMYRDRHSQFSQYYKTERGLCFCHNINGIFSELNIIYNPSEWVLFLDASTYSLKAILMHDDALYPSVPVGHGIGLKESYDNIRHLLQMIKYDTHQFYVCGDFKMIAFLIGLQQGYTKYSCFLCLWDSRDKSNHYKKTNWEPRTTHICGHHNQIQRPLVSPQKILMPTLHLKLGLMKKFVQSLDNSGPAMEYLKTLFPRLSNEKIHNGVLTGPQIKRIITSNILPRYLSHEHQEAYGYLTEVFHGFLGQTNRVRDANSISSVEKMVQSMRSIGCSMSLKLHMLHSHISFFKDFIRSSDQHGERFHQEILPMEQRYRGKLVEHMIGDYLWSIVRESNNPHRRKTNSKISQPYKLS